MEIIRSNAGLHDGINRSYLKAPFPFQIENSILKRINYFGLHWNCAQNDVPEMLEVLWDDLEQLKAKLH